MRTLLAACVLLVVSSTAFAALPYGRYWIWTFQADGTANHCARDANNNCKLYKSPEEACTDTSHNPPGLPPYNVIAEPYTINPLLAQMAESRCMGNHNSPGFFCQAPFPRCFVGIAYMFNFEPLLPYVNASCSGTSCTCNAGGRQLQGIACGGGVNAGTQCLTCTRANPVNPASGNKVQQQRVYLGLNGFELALTYNSYDQLPLRFGPQWRDTFNRSIAIESGTAIAYRADGKTLGFASSGGAWVAEAVTADRLVQTTSPAGWQLTSQNGDQVETYDSAGKLLSIRSRAGLVQTLTYSDGTSGANGGFVLDAAGNPTTFILAAGQLIGISDHFGRPITFGYDSTGRIVKATDPASGVYLFGYSASGQLVTITFPDNKVITYVYNEPANVVGTSLPDLLTGVIDENASRFATFKYDTQFRSISSEHAGTVERYQFSYSAGSTSITDPLNSVTTSTIQNVVGALGTNAIAGAVCPQCGPKAQTFDANANVSSRTDWNGNRTNYSYDLTRNLETSRTEGLTAAGATTPQTRTISTQWDTNFRLPTVIAEPLRITTMVYDATGSACGAKGATCSRSVQATTDANGSQGFSATPSGGPRAWTYTYNANGSVLTVNGPRTDVADTTTYTYYANNDATPGKRGNVATISNALGHVTQVTSYNAHGQPLTIVDLNGLTTTMTYDARLRLTSRTVGTEVTTYEYDFAGQLTKVTLPDSSFLTYSYDAAHRLTGMQDNLGNSVTYTLDAMGNRTQEQVKDPSNTLAQTRSRVYSNLNRLFQELGAQSQTTEYTYDDQGNVLTVKDPLNHTSTNQYDALNRLKQVTDPNSGVTQYGYNGLDALTQVTDPRSLVTGYTVDGLGNLTQQASPDTGSTVSAYDSAGNLLTQTDAKSQTTTYVYDALNRVALITFHDNSKQQYIYDTATNGVGRLASITETNPSNVQTSLIAYAYDQHGRVTSETRTVAGVSFVLSYQYDSFGRLSGLTYPSGRTVTYGFDSLGRVNQVSTTKASQTQVIVQNVQYHPFGGVKSWTLGNGQIYSRSIDLDGRVASYTLGATSYSIGYDAASRITAIGANTYGYDDLDRITSAVLSSSNFGYSYDAVGNRLSKTTGANSETYTYSGTSNRIATVGTRSFTFDANGSTTDDAQNTYAYDVRGRMVQATSSVGASAYQVNALGQRIRKTNGSGDTLFHYDTRGRLIAEIDPGGTVKRELFYLGDIPVGVFQ